jgi:hypothetical protein
MSEELFFAVKTIGLSKRMGRKQQTLLQAIKHNRRETQKECGSRSHIDPARSHLNRRIAGPALSADVVALAQARMAGAGYKPLRHDYTQAHELLFSLPAGTSIDTTVYFGECLQWAEAQFGVDNILSADEHHDERAPHLHILVLPMVGNLYKGAKLIEKIRLNKLRKSFAELALAFGLKEPTRRLHGAMQEVTARMVLARLESTQDAILQSTLWFTVKQDIERNPARYAAALGLVLPELAAPVKKAKTLAELRVSTGRGPKYERAEKPIGFSDDSVELVVEEVQHKPIGFEDDQDNDLKSTETIPVLVSVLMLPPPPPVRPVAIELRKPQIEDGVKDRHHLLDPEESEEDRVERDPVRVRDDDLNPALYDFDTGSWRPQPATEPARRRQAADACVAAALPAKRTDAPRHGHGPS